MSVKLLPCPFCGGEAKFVKTSDEIVPVRVELVAWNVKCSRCFASPLPNNYEGSKEAAAERWNRRAERTCRAVLHRVEYQEGVVAHTCSECGEILVCFDFEQDPPKPIGYCPGCGARVIKEDS